MRHVIVILLSIVLAGCGTSSLQQRLETFDGALAPEMQPGKAIVVIGLSINSQTSALGSPLHTSGQWTQIDRASGRTDPSLDRSVDLELRARGGFFPSGANEGTGYDFYAVPAGTYALGWFEHGGDYFFRQPMSP